MVKAIQLKLENDPCVLTNKHKFLPRYCGNRNKAARAEARTSRGLAVDQQRISGGLAVDQRWTSRELAEDQRRTSGGLAEDQRRTSGGLAEDQRSTAGSSSLSVTCWSSKSIWPRPASSVPSHCGSQRTSASSCFSSSSTCFTCQWLA